MKKSTSIIGIIVLVIIVIVVLATRSSSTPTPDQNVIASSTVPAVVSETTKVSDKLSEYQNAELGFSVKYPSTWSREEASAGVNFIAPIDKTQVSTIATLQSNIQVLSGTCAFPPVTTVKDRGTLKIGDRTLNMISMSSTVQGRAYFNRMYSLQNEGTCYMFSFSSIAQAPSSKGLSGSSLTQAQNNNKAITADADTAFTNMVKTFSFVTGPAGEDESTAAPAKK